jgi:hypothetical protein
MTLRTPDVPKIVDATTEVIVENAIVSIMSQDAIKSSIMPSLSPEMKAEIEKLLKDIVKNAFQEVLNELKKTPLASLDANADGVISVTEAKDAAQKMCCAIV